MSHAISPEPSPYAPLLALDPDALRHAQDYFRKMRADGPVTYLPELNLYAVSRYADIEQVARNTEVFSSASVNGPLNEEVAELAELRGMEGAGALLSADPPAHIRHKKLVARAFSPARVAEREPAMRLLANEAIDRFIDRGRLEFVADFAVGLPVFIVADAMGIPRERWRQFWAWSDAYIAQLGNPNPGPELARSIKESLLSYDAYFSELLEKRRKNPGDDILSDMVRRSEDGEQPLSMPELLQITGQLLTGGNETTTTMMTSAMETLLANPATMARVRADHGLIPGMIEEALRYKAPVHGMFRTATRDALVGGTEIPRGAMVWLLFSSGNYDDAVFADPTSFDIQRANANRNLAFGIGIHRCIGHLLARTEGRIAFEEFFTRLGDIRLAENSFEPRPSFVIQGLRELQLEFDLPQR